MLRKCISVSVSMTFGSFGELLTMFFLRLKLALCYAKRLFRISEKYMIGLIYPSTDQDWSPITTLAAGANRTRHLHDRYSVVATHIRNERYLCQ